jgi:hypothetical protein
MSLNHLYNKRNLDALKIGCNELKVRTKDKQAVIDLKPPNQGTPGQILRVDASNKAVWGNVTNTVSINDFVPILTTTDLNYTVTTNGQSVIYQNQGITGTNEASVNFAITGSIIGTHQDQTITTTYPHPTTLPDLRFFGTVSGISTTQNNSVIGICYIDPSDVTKLIIKFTTTFTTLGEVIQCNARIPIAQNSI